MLSFDFEVFAFKFRDRVLALPTLQFRILLKLYRANGQAVSRSEIVDFAYLDGYRPAIHTIDVHIKRIRDQTKHELIESVHGKGFRINLNSK